MNALIAERLKALVVDDEQDVCFLLSNILRGKGFEVSCVHSLHDAKESLEKAQPAIVFLDNHLPDGFGIEYIREIKKLNSDTKVVMITAYDTKSDKDKAITEGVDDFIGKPFSREHIFSTLDNLMRLEDLQM